MCYTIKIDRTREELEKRFAASFTEPEGYLPGNRVSAFSLPRLPVICSDRPDQIRLLTWGLIPYWVKDIQQAKDIRMKTFNARAETLAEKPAFRNAFERKRCLVLANGFYEWQTRDKLKIPYFINLTNHPIFALAGLYDNWTDRESGEILNTFTVVTTRANPMMEEIHNLKKRMPVILSPENEELWLDLKSEPVKSKIFEPYPEECMIAERLKL
jgi:putative SOS response-associated peptidase YedK